MIKAVFYDLGDIFFEAHYWRKWMFDYFSNNGYYQDSFCDFYYLYESYLLPVYKGESDYDSSYNKFLLRMKIKNIEEFRKISYKQKREYETNRVLFDGVLTTLEEFKKLSILNIVITDNEATEYEVRNNVLGNYNINNLLDKVVTSKDFGITKPDSKIFRSILDAYNLNNTDAIFVAHDKDEIDGAKKIGLKVIEFNNYLGLKTNADYKIKHFSEIIHIIKDNL